MRKLFSFLMTTLDGFDEGPDQEFDFWTIDDEFNAFSAEQLDQVDTLVFGRITYEGMAAYWPTASARADDPPTATRMNELPKIVVSRTLDQANWASTRVIRDAEELRAVKATDGKDIAVLGSAGLTTALLQAGLLDEVRVMVNPVILGRGRSPFTGTTERVALTLLETRVFHSGNVLLHYAPIAASGSPQ